MPGADSLFSDFTRLYTHGDVAAARARLLHTSCWIQHQRSAYGDELIARAWNAWLARCGPAECLSAETISMGDQACHLLEVQPQLGRGPVRIALWGTHNGQHARRMDCTIDTALLALSLGVNEEEFAASLPTADPLLISDYDQQRHAYAVNVGINDLPGFKTRFNSTLQTWWTVWADMQLADIGQCYASDAQVFMPGHPDAAGPDDLFVFISQWFESMQRRHFQPEQVLIDSNDPGKVAIAWHIETDMRAATGPTRVRLPLVSRLDLDIHNGLIKRDVLVADTLALRKQLQG